jgi:D-arabinose 1-dehydrogenase-like Zn-dependent alcohol dehydrogenase
MNIFLLASKIKKLISSHFCNPAEARETTQLIANGKIFFEPSKTLEFEKLIERVVEIKNRKSLGKIAIKFS